jgi:hypothetical protein
VTVVERVHQALRAHVERQKRQLAEQRDADLVQEMERIRAMALREFGADGQAGIPLTRSQLGTVASVLRYLTQEGQPTDAQVEAFMGREGWAPEVVQAALIQLKASGHYQRIIEDAGA